MAAKSLKASPEGVNRINLAMADKEWSRDDLAEQCHCSRQPAVNFCSGKKRVRRDLFIRFCEALELPWLEIVEADLPKPEPDNDIDALVQEVRAKVKDDIQYRCGTMRVLDMEQAIGVDDVYTSVNILERLTGRRRLEISELLGDCDPANFDRFMLGQVKQKRVPGLEAVERYDRLMILGKPGAGKTTFMKRLATLCNHGRFQAGRVPVFVTLKEFAEAAIKPELQDYIARQWQSCNIQGADTLANVLDAGHALVLLDGLDEVREEDHDRVLRNIRDFTREFRACQFVMTCRIAAREYTFQQFTEVEIADFDSEQIADFAAKWFKARNDVKKGSKFVERVESDQPIKELATNPLLLTLLCLVFGEAGDFPRNRAELYKEGLDVLLKKWDASRNIERYQAYKKLSLRRKEDLLSWLAYQTFKKGEYFFKQQMIERQIIDYIRNLPGASEDEDTIQLDSEAVLQSISAQHGLLIARANGIYSFSHLTFQEYFTAKYITRSTAQLSTTLQQLATRVTDRRYREIFLLSVSMLPEADDLLLATKKQVDQLIVDDESLQKLTTWINEKTNSAKASYESVAIRAFYFELYFHLFKTLHYLSAYHRDYERYLSFHKREGILVMAVSLYRNNSCCLEIAFPFEFLFHSCSNTLSPSRSLELCLSLSTNFDLELNFKLDSLKSYLLGFEQVDDEEGRYKGHEKQKLEKLRIVAMNHRDIDYDWQSVSMRKNKIGQYYYANKLISDCLKNDCYISKSTRREIAETALLPVEEVQRWK